LAVIFGSYRNARDVEMENSVGRLRLLLAAGVVVALLPLSVAEAGGMYECEFFVFAMERNPSNEIQINFGYCACHSGGRPRAQRGGSCGAHFGRGPDEMLWRQWL
jgi:hypothetical protein